jgi:hypothetical protein
VVRSLGDGDVPKSKKPVSALAGTGFLLLPALAGFIYAPASCLIKSAQFQISSPTRGVQDRLASRTRPCATCSTCPTPWCELAAWVQDLEHAGGETRAAEFRDRSDLGRKHAIRCWSFLIGWATRAACAKPAGCVTPTCSRAQRKGFETKGLKRKGSVQLGQRYRQRLAGTLRIYRRTSLRYHMTNIMTNWRAYEHRYAGRSQNPSQPSS